MLGFAAWRVRPDISRKVQLPDGSIPLLRGIAIRVIARTRR
jgi:hypothetical protein